jgi:NhaP-type Na+/H+ or K+/H+ antiporter
MGSSETYFLLIAAALVISALVSGLVTRGPVSFPMIFLGLGLLLGTQFEDSFHIEVHDPGLEAVAVASLSFVLFLDALKLRIDELGRDWTTPALVLGPGTLVTVGIVAAASYFLLEVTVTQALLLGAVLASTDAVVVRDIVRDRRLPRSIRNVLSFEAGVNDVVVLPLILVLIAAAQSEASSVFDWLRFAGEVFIIGPVVGAVVAAGGAWLMLRIDRLTNVSREYQALFGVGLVLLTFLAGDAAGGVGFLASFGFCIGVILFNY